ncbi:hypothetical protein RQP46_002219 [Phenoliferia psychrophenolica]
MLASNLLRLVLVSLLPIALTTKGVVLVLGDDEFNPIEMIEELLSGKATTGCTHSGAAGCIGKLRLAASERARSRRNVAEYEALEKGVTVCAANEKACPSGSSGLECVGKFEDCQES